MTATATRDPMFTAIDDKADSTEAEHTADIDARSDLGLQPGECRRVDGLPSGRHYHLRVGDLFLIVSQHSVREGSLSGMQCNESYGTAEPVSAGEAFEFLHGDYSPEKEYFCLSCGASHKSTEDKPCGCPVGSEPQKVEWPDVPVRRPRRLINGELLARRT
ncbi:hypothetical protein ACOJIV_18325 [Haloarcula sp. AONF1]